MADDDTTKKTTEGTEDLAKATQKQADAMKQMTQSTRPATKALNSWNLETDAAIGNQERLADVIRQETDEIKKQVKEMGSLNMQVKDISGSIQGFMGNLKRHMSVSHQYNRLLKQMREGQKDYTASLQLSTSELGKASAQSQKHIDALNDAYIEARMRAAEYGLEAQEVEAHTRELHGAFGAQLQAMGNVGVELKKLQKSTFAFSRFMGIDYSESVRHIDDRLMHSTKTLEEVRQETLLVAKSADTYANNLKKLGKRALQTGNITKQGFLKIIQEIGSEFKSGKFAAEGFAKSTALFLEVGKKHGMTPEEAKQMATGFGKVISQMGSAQSIFGIKTAQVFGNMLTNIGQIQDENLRKRLGYYAKRQEEQGALNILDLRGIAAAVKGSSEGINMLLGSLEKLNLPENALRAIVGEMVGPEQQHLADLLVEQIRSGELRKGFEKESLAHSKKGGEEAELQTAIWEKDLYTMVKEGATATDQRYKAIRAIEEFKGKMLAWLDKYWIFIVAAQSAQTISSLFGRGGMLSGLLGRGGAGAASTAATGAAGAGRMALAGKALGVAGAAYTGWNVGKWLNTKVGEDIASGQFSHHMGEQAQGNLTALMGKDRTLANFLSMKLMEGGGGSAEGFTVNKEGWEDLKENTVRIRGAVTEAHKQTYKQRQKQINDAKRDWKKLDKNQRKQIEKAEEQNKQLKRFIEKGSMSDAEKKAYDKEQTKLLSKDFIENANKLKKEETGKDFTKEGFQNYIEDFVGMTGRVTGPANIQVAVDALMKSKEGMRIVKKAKKGKAVESEADVRKILAQAILKRRAGGLWTPTSKQTKTEKMEEAQNIYGKIQKGKIVDPYTLRAAAEWQEKIRQQSSEKALKLDIGTVDTGAAKEVVAKVGADNSIEATFPATRLKIRGKDSVKVNNNHEALNRAKKPPVP